MNQTTDLAPAERQAHHDLKLINSLDAYTLRGILAYISGANHDLFLQAVNTTTHG